MFHTSATVNLFYFADSQQVCAKGLVHAHSINDLNVTTEKAREITHSALTFASFTIVLLCVSMKHKKLDVWRRLTKFLTHTHVAQPSRRDIGQERQISLRHTRNSPALRVLVGPPTRPFPPITSSGVFIVTALRLHAPEMWKLINRINE